MDALTCEPARLRRIRRATRIRRQQPRKADGPVVFDPLGSNAGLAERLEPTLGTESTSGSLEVQRNQARQGSRRLTLGAFPLSRQNCCAATNSQLIDGKSVILNYTFGIGARKRSPTCGGLPLGRKTRAVSGCACSFFITLGKAHASWIISVTGNPCSA